MALSHPDRRPFALLAAAVAMLPLLLAQAASDQRDAIVLRRGANTNLNMQANFNSGTMSLENLDLAQGNTILTAGKANATGLVDGKFENSTWKLTGGMHLELDGAILEAQAATVVFADGRLRSAEVQPAPAPIPQPPKSPVHLEFSGAVLDAQSASVAFADGRMRSVQALGSPAQFSHQFKGSPRRVHGRANKVDFDAIRNQVRFTGDTRYSDGSYALETQELYYNLGDGSFGAPTPSSGTRTDERVPAPRTPDRTSAK